MEIGNFLISIYLVTFMILILSQKKEPTTDRVIDWLLSKNASFIRLNSEDLLNNESLFIDIAKGVLKINDIVISTENINVVWYRRWNEFDFKLPENISNRNQLSFELNSEVQEISQYIFQLFSNKKVLCNPLANKYHNKLYTLFLAKKNGLNIPNSFIVNSKLPELDNQKKEFITKPISDSRLIVDMNQNFAYKSFTEDLNFSTIDEDTSFFPSLIQEKINSFHEIRCFYLDGKFFPTAILNSKTLDIKRSVGFSEAVRMVPFKFPEQIENKINGLMSDLGLNCGAIDIIKTNNGEFYFLEVNPVGQVLGYSDPVNYNVEQEIANWLINNNYE